MKLINTGDLRQVNDQYLRQEITFSLAAEMLNEIANQKAAEHLSKKLPEIVRHLMDFETIKTYRKNRWTDIEIADSCMKGMEINPIKI